MFDIDGNPIEFNHRLKHICEYGHNNNPNPRLNAGGIDPNNLDPGGPAAGKVIASWQESYGLQSDGVWGPETEKTLAVARCGHPDHQSAGRGTFGQPCHDKIRFSVNRRKNRVLSEDDINQIVSWVVGAFASIGARLVEVAAGEDAQIEVYWYPLAGSTIGLAQLTSGDCSRSLFCRLDPAYGSAGVVQNAQLLLHEMGHNFGLEHTRRGVMSPTIERNAAFTGWRTSDASHATLARWYGGNPLDPITPPPEDRKSIRLDVDGGLVTAYEADGTERGQWIPQVELGQLVDLFPWHHV